jgi:hypothetical protein
MITVSNIIHLSRFVKYGFQEALDKQTVPPQALFVLRSAWARSWSWKSMGGLHVCQFLFPHSV